MECTQKPHYFGSGYQPPPDSSTLPKKNENEFKIPSSQERKMFSKPELVFLLISYISGTYCESLRNELQFLLPTASPEDLNLYQELLNLTKDDYFLPESELPVKMENMFSFIEEQRQKLTDPDTPLIQNKTKGFAPPKLNFTALGFPDISQFRQILRGFGDNFKRDAACGGCQVFLGLMAHRIKYERADKNSLLQFTIFTCQFFGLADPEVCSGVMERLGPSFYYIVKSRPKIKPSIMCGLLLQSIGCRIPSKAILGSDFEWNVDTLRKPGHQIIGYPVPRPEIEVIASQDFKNPEIETKRGETKIVKIVHLADLHIDYDYKEGTDAECKNEVLCCQERSGEVPENVTLRAGKFGDNRKCDAPISILHMALSHLQKQHGSDIDIIYMTGDLVPHNIWYSTREDNEETIRNVSKVIHDYFPTATVIPCLGNHEPHPVNLFSPTSRTFGSQEKNPIDEDIRTDWVYETAYEAWKQWIPESEAETFLASGHYAIEINDKFRVLVVNTNICYGFNLWQLYDPQDPGGQLEWLQKQLEHSATLGKRVHILGHVPPGHEDCFKTWSREFYKIVAKYRSTIRGQFYGHTHYDEFRILHDPSIKSDPINVLWIGPSLTPYRIYNPGYRIYHASLDEATYGDVMDHETWIYDLDGANRAANQSYLDVPWFQLYRATETYQIPNLLPHSLRKYVRRLAKNRKDFDTFYRLYFKAASEHREECDTLCRKRILCGMVQAYYDDDDGQVECADVQKEVDGIVVPMRVLEHRKRFIWL